MARQSQNHHRELPASLDLLSIPASLDLDLEKPTRSHSWWAGIVISVQIARPARDLRPFAGSWHYHSKAHPWMYRAIDVVGPRIRKRSESRTRVAHHLHILHCRHATLMHNLGASIHPIPVRKDMRGRRIIYQGEDAPFRNGNGCLGKGCGRHMDGHISSGGTTGGCPTGREQRRE